MAFEKLREIIELEVDYKTKSALTISTGRQPGEIVESQVIKLGGVPVIPGSSLKGLLRSTLEAMLAAQGVPVCVPYAAIPRSLRQPVETLQNYVRGLDRLEPCSDVANPCPVCAIFGSIGARTGLSGRAIILDAIAEEGKYELIERSHVAITRDTKSQAEGSLMSLEAVDAGAVFKGKVRIINPDPWQVGAIVQALRGVSLLGAGGKKTAGYGDLEIAVTSSRSIKFENGQWQETEVQLQSFIQAFTAKLQKITSRRK